MSKTSQVAATSAATSASITTSASGVANVGGVGATPLKKKTGWAKLALIPLFVAIATGAVVGVGALAWWLVKRSSGGDGGGGGGAGRDLSKLTAIANNAMTPGGEALTSDKKLLGATGKYALILGDTGLPELRDVASGLVVRKFPHVSGAKLTSAQLKFDANAALALVDSDSGTVLWKNTSHNPDSALVVDDATARVYVGAPKAGGARWILSDTLKRNEGVYLGTWPLTSADGLAELAVVSGGEGAAAVVTRKIDGTTLGTLSTVAIAPSWNTAEFYVQDGDGNVMFRSDANIKALSDPALLNKTFAVKVLGDGSVVALDDKDASIGTVGKF